MSSDINSTNTDDVTSTLSREAPEVGQVSEPRDKPEKPPRSPQNRHRRVIQRRKKQQDRVIDEVEAALAEMTSPYLLADMEDVLHNLDGLLHRHDRGLVGDAFLHHAQVVLKDQLEVLKRRRLNAEATRWLQAERRARQC